MDSLTQIVLGASVGEAALGKKVGNKAMLWGAIGGTIPDLDVIANFFVDRITANELHRGFSHSIVFSILAAPILGWIIFKLYHRKKEATQKEWTWLAFLALFTHPVLDCFTGYGTQLFWPFEYRVAFDNIFVADPLYTVPFLLFVLAAMFFKRESGVRTKLNRLGLFISSGYMLLTLGFKYYGFQKFAQNLKDQNIKYTELNTRPAPLNSLLWVANVETEDELLIGYSSILDRSDFIRFYHYPKNYDLANDFIHEEKLKRLIKISKGWYMFNRDAGQTYFNDIRFGPLKMDGDPNYFVYRFAVGYNKGKEFYAKASQNRPENMGSLFNHMIRRIWEEPEPMQTDKQPLPSGSYSQSSNRH